MFLLVVSKNYSLFLKDNKCRFKTRSLVRIYKFASPFIYLYKKKSFYYNALAKNYSVFFHLICIYDFFSTNKRYFKHKNNYNILFRILMCLGVNEQNQF